MIMMVLMVLTELSRFKSRANRVPGGLREDVMHASLWKAAVGVDLVVLVLRSSRNNGQRKARVLLYWNA